MTSSVRNPLTNRAPTSSEAVPHEWPVRIYVQDTDMGGVVYHSRYLDFAERARAELLRAQGLSLTLLASGSNSDKLASESQAIAQSAGGHAVTIVVSALEVSYHKPAQLDDLLTVRTSLIKASKARFQLLQDIVCLDNPAMGEGAVLCASLKVTLACVTKTCAKLPETKLPEKGVTGTRGQFKAVRPPDCLGSAMFAYYLGEK